MVAHERFVGREAELAALGEALDPRRSAANRAVLVVGAGGAGKTRFVEEAVNRAGFPTAFVRCWADASPMWPWRQALRLLRVGAAPHDPPVPLGDRFAEFTSIADALLERGADGRVVIVLDDVHHADPASLLMARFLTRSVPAANTTLVLTSRPLAELRDDRHCLVRELLSESRLIELGGLTLDEVRELLIDSGHDVSDTAIVETISRLSDGNPLVLRTLDAAAHARRSLPAGIQHVVVDALRRLHTDDRTVVQVTASLGPRPVVGDIAAVTASVVPPSESASFLDPSVGIGTVRVALERARAAKLIEEVANGSVTFPHELVREAIAESVEADVRAALHAAAARTLSAGEPNAERMANAAGHALEAWAGSPSEVGTAIDIAQRAAVLLQQASGFESATALLDRAVRVAQLGLPGRHAGLLVQRARALLSCGRVADARTAFRGAVKVAEQEGETELLAEAALGISGVWLHEHRTVPEVQEVTALQHRALELLAASTTTTAAVLRARLRVRVASESAFLHEGALADAEAAVDDVRALGNPGALVEALALLTQLLVAPSAASHRGELVEEMIAAAAEAGDPFATLRARCWQTVHLFLSGQTSAAHFALTELIGRAEAHQCESMLYQARCMEVMEDIRRGELDAAEHRAESCFAIGQRIGDRDAHNFLAAHLSTIRYFQGRSFEPMAAMGGAADSYPVAVNDSALEAGAALFALRQGRHEPARVLLDRVASGWLPPRSGSLLVTYVALIEAAHILDHRAAARVMRNAVMLEPDAPAMVSLAVTCFGPIARSLALATWTLGDAASAERYARHAILVAIDLGHRPAEVLSRGLLATILRARDTPEATTEADEQAEMAIEAAADFGMQGWIPRWPCPGLGTHGAALRDGPGRAGAVPQFTRVDDRYWRVELYPEVTVVVGRVGTRYLAALTSSPRTDISAVWLASGGTDIAESAQGIADRAAMADLHARAVALRTQLDEVGGSARRRERLEHELDEVLEAVRSLTGLDGRVRSFAGGRERARTSVRKAILRAIDDIEARAPVIAEVLRAGVTTGTTCRFDPVS